jgi:hypothetical protein
MLLCTGNNIKKKIDIPVNLIRLYKTIIRPVVTYGAERWTVISKMEKNVNDMGILRKIYGTTKENGQWRIKTNEELMTKYKAPDIVNVIKIRRLE